MKGRRLGPMRVMIKSAVMIVKFAYYLNNQYNISVTVQKLGKAIRRLSQETVLIQRRICSVYIFLAKSVISL